MKPRRLGFDAEEQSGRSRPSVPGTLRPAWSCAARRLKIVLPCLTVKFDVNPIAEDRSRGRRLPQGPAPIFVGLSICWWVPADPTVFDVGPPGGPAGVCARIPGLVSGGTSPGDALPGGAGEHRQYTCRSRSIHCSAGRRRADGVVRSPGSSARGIRRSGNRPSARLAPMPGPVGWRPITVVVDTEAANLVAAVQGY